MKPPSCFPTSFMIMALTPMGNKPGGCDVFHVVWSQWEFQQPKTELLHHIVHTYIYNITYIYIWLYIYIYDYIYIIIYSIYNTYVIYYIAILWCISLHSHTGCMVAPIIRYLAGRVRSGCTSENSHGWHLPLDSVRDFPMDWTTRGYIIVSIMVI